MTKLIGIMLVLLSVCIEAIGQVALKKSAMSPVGSSLRRTTNIVGVVFLGLEAVIWTLVLKCMDVSVAFPMGALSFVTTALFSAAILKEKIDLQRWAGVATIVCGTVCLSLG